MPKHTNIRDYYIVSGAHNYVASLLLIPCNYGRRQVDVHDESRYTNVIYR